MDFVVGYEFVFAWVVAGLRNVRTVSLALMTVGGVRIVGRLQGFSCGNF